jgi:hypothetical protein
MLLCTGIYTSKIDPALASRIGRVTVQVWENDRSEESIAALKHAGPEIRNWIRRTADS